MKIDRESRFFNLTSELMHLLQLREYELVSKFSIKYNIIIAFGELYNEEMMYSPNGLIFKKSGIIKAYKSSFEEEILNDEMEYIVPEFESLKRDIDYSYNPKTKILTKFK